ncbi:hypothetical protein MMC07_000787 [Pseudocyphellaria aurata]|nr:hypothetical protein [Pseudocyphellaria aurata]
MPKKKQYLNRNAKKGAVKEKSSGPETAIEFLSVGVDLEEAGEKWRAGDAVKSTRFFVRAIENYDAGLRKFPLSFDLAYNKARLQYEIAQQPRLLVHLPDSSISPLQLALNAHKAARSIDQDNADLLFNTAQVLTSLAEASSESQMASDAVREEALGMFQEALELFQRCLQVQEARFALTEEQASQVTETAGEYQGEDVDMSPPSLSDGSGDEEWATIMEPITKDTLLDTVIAQLETLTAMCGVMGSQATNGISWIEEYYRDTIQEKLRAYNLPLHAARNAEIALKTANFACALCDAGFRGGHLDLATYERELSAAFTQTPSLQSSPQALCDQADAELGFNASIQALLPTLLDTDSPHSLAHLNGLRWTHITRALDAFTAASKLPDAQNRPRIHLRRGDCELFRHRLSEASPWGQAYGPALKSAKTLVKNAETYYRGAGALARHEGAADEEREAAVKEAVTWALMGQGGDRLAGLEGVREVVQEMLDEDLLSEQSGESIWKLLPRH